jgi:hypothetical protein
MLYADYTAQESSEKIGLVVLEASKRLMGWTLYSGSIYYVSGDYAVISDISDSGTALTESTTLGGVTAGKFYNDKANGKIYLRTSDSVNPNGKFVHIRFKMFFSNNGVKAPWDLASGFDVEWLPLLKQTSDFTLNIDNQNQLGMAIEGGGTVSFYNDHEFWAPKFDKLYFENQRVWIYSWSRSLPASEAKIIFKGRIQGKTWTTDQVSFNLKDQLNELRAPVALNNLEDTTITYARIADGLKKSKQRKIYGYIYGHVCTPIDGVLDGYPLELPLTFTQGSATVTIGFSGTLLSQLVPGDQLWVTNKDIKYTIASIATNDLSLTLSEVYAEPTISDIPYFVPNRERYNVNRHYLVAGHPIRKCDTTVLQGLGLNMFDVADATDITAGDTIYFPGSGQIVEVEYCSGSRIKITTNLTATPLYGDQVIRPGVQSVYLNKTRLAYLRDYTVNETNATITLSAEAEKNNAAVKKLNGTVTFTNTSRTVTGSGTAFSSDLKPGDYLRTSGEVDYFEVFSIESNTSLTLKDASSYSHSGVTGYFKSPDYATADSVLSCDAIGATDDGLVSGNLIKTAPQIVRKLVEDTGLTVNSASFTEALDLVESRIGVVIPERYEDTNAPSVRDVINKINQSIFGILYQNQNFELSYSVIQPTIPSIHAVVNEHDVLKFSVKSDSQRIVKTAVVRYLKKEYNYTTGESSFEAVQKVSDNAQYLAESEKEYIQETILVDESAAQIYANRWAFILEHASSVLEFDTKLQAMQYNINDPIEVVHEKLYERVGSPLGRKIALVHEIKKSHLDSSASLEDLSGAFSRIGVIVPNSSDVYSDASDATRFSSSFITDNYGMIDNDPDTFDINLIW